MHLEVEFAAPDVEVGRLRRDFVHRAFGESEADRRAAVQRRAADAALHVFLLGAAAAVADAEQADGHIDDARLAVASLVAAKLLGQEARVVGVFRREVRDDARAVDALPDEGVVRELVVAVPG